MDNKKLFKLLKAHEWNDVEFKQARKAIPKNAYESVSAFANTEGGHLVFGVKKNGSNFEVVGVLNVDKMQNEFLSALRQENKISQIVDVKTDFPTPSDQVDNKIKPDLVTAITQTIKLSDKQRAILKKCEAPRRMAELHELFSKEKERGNTFSALGKKP